MRRKIITTSSILSLENTRKSAFPTGDSETMDTVYDLARKLDFSEEFDSDKPNAGRFKNGKQGKRNEGSFSAVLVGTVG